MTYRTVCDACDLVAEHDQDVLTLNVPEEGFLETTEPTDEGYHIFHFCSWYCLGKAVNSLVTPAAPKEPEPEYAPGGVLPGQEELDLEPSEQGEQPAISPEQLQRALGITRKM